MSAVDRGTASGGTWANFSALETLNVGYDSGLIGDAHAFLGAGKRSTSPASTTDYEQYTYDANSNVTQDRRRDGATISYAYDNLNRASTMTPSTGSVVSYAYDNFSRMTQAAFTGHTLTFGYDQLSRNTSAGGPLGTVNYQYDLAGQRTRITWPDSFYAQYDYDLTGAVTAIRENGATSGVGVLATYAYDNLARRTSVTRGNGTTTTYDYDAAGRLEELAQNLASTANDVTFNFTYNASSQAITRDRTTSNSGYVWPQPANNTQNSTANGLNQIAQLSGTNFTYDGRGNLTSTGAATYGYDVYNRLTSAGSATLSYDPTGRLYQTTSNGSTVTARLQYDGADLIAEYNGSNTLLRRYVHGPGIDEPIVWYEGSGTSDRRWLHQDQLGSVVAASDSSGALIGSPNTYDEYGVPGSSNAGRFQYTGQTWLSDASLYHYKARVYLPTIGRFAQSNPVLYADGMNIYDYVGGDPVNLIDPMGLDCHRIQVGVRVLQAWWGEIGSTVRVPIYEYECDREPSWTSFANENPGSGESVSNPPQPPQRHCPTAAEIESALQQVKMGNDMQQLGGVAVAFGSVTQFFGPEAYLPSQALMRAGAFEVAVGPQYRIRRNQCSRLTALTEIVFWERRGPIYTVAFYHQHCSQLVRKHCRQR